MFWPPCITVKNIYFSYQLFSKLSIILQMYIIKNIISVLSELTVILSKNGWKVI